MTDRIGQSSDGLQPTQGSQAPSSPHGIQVGWPGQAAAVSPAQVGLPSTASAGTPTASAGTPTASAGTPITVLGVGNPIMGDDGVGLELLAGVQAALEADPRVDFIDGGTGGMELLPVVQDARRLLVLDAVTGDSPGDVRTLTGDQVARMLSLKLSPHQVGLLDVFTAARLLGREPDTVVIVGVVPEAVDLRLGLSPSVAAGVPDAVSRAVAQVRSWLASVDA